MASSLPERIHAALTDPGSVSAADVRVMQTEVAAALARAEADALSARERAFDPRTLPAEVPAARAEMELATFERDRLAASVTSLRSLYADRHAVEAEAERRTAYEAARSERDQLVKDLEERYPTVAAELADMLRRISESDARNTAVNAGLPSGSERLASAESIARGCPEHFYMPTGGAVMRLGAIKLPHLAAGSQTMAWPPGKAYADL